MDWSRAASVKEPFVALVPGEDVPLIKVDIPVAIQGFEREKILRRRVKDSFGLSADAADLRPFAAGPKQKTWKRALLGDPHKLAVWRASEGVTHPHCRAVLPDYLGLPTGAGVWVVAGDNRRIIVRFGPDDGASGEADLILAQMEIIVAVDLPKAIFIDGEIPAKIAEFAQTHAVAICTDVDTLKSHVTAPLQVFGNGELALDLRQEPRAAEAKMRQRLAAWRWPVVMGVLGAGLWAASLAIQTQLHDTRTAEIRRETVSMLRENLVPTGPVLDIPVQVNTRLAQLRRDNAPVLQAMPAVELFKRVSQDLTGTGLIEARFETGAGLEIDVELSSFAAVDELVARLVAREYVVQVAESNAREGGVFARLKIAEPKQVGALQ